MAERFKNVLTGIRAEIKAHEKELVKLRKAEAILVGDPAPVKKPNGKRTAAPRTKPGVLEGYMIQVFRTTETPAMTVKNLVAQVKRAGHKFHSDTHEDAVLRSCASRMVKAGKLTRGTDGDGYVTYSMAKKEPTTTVETLGEPSREPGKTEDAVDLTDRNPERKPDEPVHAHRKGMLTG